MSEERNTEEQDDTTAEDERRSAAGALPGADGASTHGARATGGTDQSAATPGPLESLTREVYALRSMATATVMLADAMLATLDGLRRGDASRATVRMNTETRDLLDMIRNVGKTAPPRTPPRTFGDRPPATVAAEPETGQGTAST